MGTTEPEPRISLTLPGRVLGRWYLVLQSVVTVCFVALGLSFFFLASLPSDARGIILYATGFVLSIAWILIWLVGLWLAAVLVLGEDRIDVRDGVLSYSRRFRHLRTPVRRIELGSAAGLKVSRQVSWWGRPYVSISGDRVNAIRVGYGIGSAEMDRVTDDLASVVAYYAPDRDPGYRMVL